MIVTVGALPSAEILMTYHRHTCGAYNYIMTPAYVNTAVLCCEILPPYALQQKC
jgi:hypothetical protein